MRKDISALHRKFQPLALKFEQECAKAGLPIIFTCTLRDIDEQAKLYAQGRTTPGKVVTNAKPGSSWHNYGLAFDICFKNTGYDGPWEKVGAIGERLGLTWGGHFKSFQDKPHFEWHPGLTTAKAQAQVKSGIRPTELNL